MSGSATTPAPAGSGDPPTTNFARDYVTMLQHLAEAVLIAKSLGLPQERPHYEFDLFWNTLGTGKTELTVLYHEE